MPHVEPAMHAITVVLVGAVLATSCGAIGRSPGAAPSPTGPTEPPVDRIYAEVIRQLVTVDHTFGDGPSPFRHVYVVDGVIPAEAPSQVGPAAQPFSETLKRAIADRLEDLPPLEFISDPDAVRLGDEGLDGVRRDGVIVSLGPIEPAGDDVHVPAGLWCGGLCGQWLTYVLTEGEWRITGTTGPVAIA